LAGSGLTVAGDQAQPPRKATRLNGSLPSYFNQKGWERLGRFFERRLAGRNPASKILAKLHAGQTNIQRAERFYCIDAMSG
jgi:hypothetical protein